jgi:hypothetical protein
VRLCDTLFPYVTSTYQKHASVTSPLDLPLVSISTFLEGVLVLPDSGQVGGSSSNNKALSSLQASGPALHKLDVRLRTFSGGFFFFFYPRAPYTNSPAPCIFFASTRRRLSRFAYMSIGGLRDMGTHGSPPTRVPEVPVEWTRPVRSPADLQVGPETLSTIPATLEDLGRPHPDSRRPARLVTQSSPLDCGTMPPVGPRIMGSSL